MSHQVEAQLLNALELFQYANRFRDSLFVLAFDPGVSPAEVLTDLKVLQASKIATAIVCRDTREQADAFKKLSKRGFAFCYRGFDNSRIEQIGEILGEARETLTIPVFALANGQEQSLSLLDAAWTIADACSAAKLLFLTAIQGLRIDGGLLSHLQPRDIPKLLNSSHELNTGRELLELIEQRSRRSPVEFVLLETQTGSLFQEVFTHQGRGTLFSNEYSNEIRRAQLADVFDISRLLQPYIVSGAVLPTTDDHIAEEIDSYFVFAVNGAIVAAAQLADYGEACALAKFCTLPRYRGRGRAKQLGRRLIKAARKAKKDYVFALSIEPRMWSFFLNLGFAEVSRETLPESWKKDYDFSRPSRAFKLSLSTKKKTE